MTRRITCDVCREKFKSEKENFFHDCCVHSWCLFQEGNGEGGKLFWYCTKCRKTEVKK